jgi:hypothetical protein
MAHAPCFEWTRKKDPSEAVLMIYSCPESLAKAEEHCLLREENQ